ncbi:MAG: amino acid ABC transporter permease [Propionibacteriaceae bacterium]
MLEFLQALKESAPLFLPAAWLTIRITATAVLLAMILGSVVAGLAMSTLAPLRWLGNGFIGLIRGTPLLTQIFILYFGLTGIVALPAFWAGAIALAVHNSAYIAEIFRSGFQSVPVGLTEASRSLGMSRVQTLRRVRGPLALRTTLPVLGSQLIIAVKDSSLVAFVALPELFQTAMRLTAQTYEPMTYYLIVALWYLLLVLILTVAVNLLERRLSHHLKPAGRGSRRLFTPRAGAES